jgi:hypothetical protein
MENLFSINSRETLFRAILGLSLLISIFLSYSLVSKNYYFLFFVIGLAMSLFLMKSKTLPVVIILSVIPFTDWAIEQGFLPFLIMWFPELLSGLLFLKVLVQSVARKQNFRTAGFRFVLLFLFIAFYSLIYNSSGLIPALLMLRLLFRYYILFLAILNLDLDEKAMKLINSFVIIIFLLQLPLAIIKLFVYGQGETSLGLSSHSISTMIPLIAVSFLFSFYFLYKKRIAYLSGIFCFVGFSFVGGKRAFIFFFVLLIAFLLWVLKKQIRLNLKAIFLAVMLICISFYFAARLLPRFNPQNKIWGEFNIKHIINFVFEYETGVTGAGMTGGRISTSINVFNLLSKGGPLHWAFGFGPGVIVKSMFAGYDRRENLEKRFGIVYGENGLSWLAIQVGYLGAFLFFLFLYVFLKESYLYFRQEDDQYWQSVGSGMVGFTFIYLITCLVYIPFFNFSGVSVFYFYLLAIVVLRKRIMKAQKNTATHQSCTT